MKKHDVLAERLADELKPNGRPSPANRPTISNNGTVHDLCVEVAPFAETTTLFLPEVVVQTCGELMEEHHLAQLLRSYGLRPRNRVLLAGAVRKNGKTSLAEALGPTASTVPFIVARYDGLIASYLGETASRLRRLFDLRPYWRLRVILRRIRHHRQRTRGRTRNGRN